MFKKVVRTKLQTLEQDILEKIISISMLVIIGYLTYDMFALQKYDEFLKTFIPFCGYGILLLMLRYNSNLELVKVLVFCVFLFSIISGFFFFNGFNGVGVFDICNMIPAILIIFNGRKLPIFFGSYIAVIIGLAYVHLYHHHLIINSRTQDAEWFNIVEIFARFLLAFKLVYILKAAYIKDFKDIRTLNTVLQEKNREIETQKDEIFSQAKRIHKINELLQVKLKTKEEKIRQLDRKVVEYTFLNSHTLRAPMARILGIVGLASLELKKNEHSNSNQYFDIIHDNAVELDNVIKHINHMLDERDELLNS